MGKARKGMRVLAVALLAMAGLAPWAAWADTAGIFQFVAGDVRVAGESGGERVARKGTLLNTGDTVSTAHAATAQIKMGDGAIVVMQPDSRLTVAVFHYAGVEDGSERVVWRLEQGGFRSITGAIGRTHKNNYLIETPIAHMGVRGTDHESYYFPPGGSEKPGAYNKVNTGITYIATDRGEVVIAPNQVGYVASRDSAPQLLGSVPGFFNRAVAPRAARLNAPESVPPAPPVKQGVATAGGMSLESPAGAQPGTSQAAEGSVAGYSERSGAAFFGRSTVNPAITPNGAVLANAGSDAAWGVDWGTWQGTPSVDGAIAAGSAQFVHTTNLTSASQLASLGANGVSGTYSYLGGPAPTNQSGTQGTVNSLSVGVNFAKQTVTSYALSATVDSKTWQAKGSGSIAQFTSSSGIALSGSCAGCTTAPATAASGTATGAFVGPAAERMITAFGLKSSTLSMSGAAYLGR